LAVKIHSRTVSLTATLTYRSRGDPPEWLLRVGRHGGNPREYAVASEVDIERSAGENAPVREAGPSPTGASVVSHSDATGELATQLHSEIPLDSIRLSDMSKVASPEINQDNAESNGQDITEVVADAGGHALGRVQSRTVHFPSSE